MVLPDRLWPVRDSSSGRRDAPREMVKLKAEKWERTGKGERLMKRGRIMGRQTLAGNGEVKWVRDFR